MTKISNKHQGLPSYAITITGKEETTRELSKMKVGKHRSSTQTPLRTNSMRKTILSILLCLVATISFAYREGDKFTTGGITYTVISPTAYTLTASSATSEACVGNTITVPFEVYDPQDINMKYTVDQVRFYGSNTLPGNVTDVIVSEGTTRIGSFYTNSQVRYIKIPKTVETVSTLNLSGVKVFDIDPENPYLKFVYDDESKDPNAGLLMNAAGTKLLYHVLPATNIYGDGGDYYIPETVTEIIASVFGSEKYVKVLHVGKNVNNFNASGSSSSSVIAFDVDPENTSYTTHEGVLYSKTGDLLAYPRGKKDEVFNVWEGCTRLKEMSCEQAYFKEINLNNVTTVETNAFRFTPNLKKIVFTNAVTTFHNSQNNGSTSTYVFKDDDDDPELTDEQKANSTNHPVFNLIDGVLFSKDNKTLIACPSGLFKGEEYVIPDGVTNLDAHAFHYSYIKKIVGNPELTSMKSSSFTYSQIEEVDFSACTGLTSMTGFENSKNLKNVALSPSMETLSGLSGCTSLVEIRIPDNSKLKSISQDAFKGLTGLKSFIFEGSCPNFTSIGNRAFYGCTGLESFVVPSSTKTIGTSAFSGCVNLEGLTFAEPSSLETISANAFVDTSAKSIVIPSSIKSISSEAFMNCDNLESITIPAVTTNISAEAFKYCNNLTEIIVDKDNPTYSGVDGFLLSKDKETLLLFPPGKANDRFTLLPPSITKIGDYSFYSCTNLKNVTIPNKVTSIGDRAFGLCSELNTITFLCDQMIDPANIDQRQNHNSFDESMFPNITINVRESMKDTYANNEFYKKFGGGVHPSFRIDGKNEYIAVSDKAVDMLELAETDHTYVVPGSINHDSKNFTVSLIGDFACQNTPTSVKEIVMFNNVEYIGAKAFKQTGTQSIENLFFVQKEPTKQLLSTTRFELTPDDLPLVDGHKDDQYKEFDDNMKIYVRKSAFNTCLNDWHSYANMIDYKVKDTQVKTKYGTFAREFDVDFSDCAAQGGNEIIAFTAACSEKKEGTGDFGDTEYHIEMESIYCDVAGKDGVYVPKNTGVLLKCMDSDTTTEAYYCISDRNDDNLPGYSGANVMKGITVNEASLTGSSTDSRYVMSGGAFRYVTPSTTLTMPLHRAYMELKDVTTGAKVVMHLGEETTEVKNITNDAVTNGAIYNMQGMKVEKASRGLYIVNGKKYVKM